MIKNISANKFLRFIFEKYWLQNKHINRRIYCMSLVVQWPFFITYNVQKENEKKIKFYLHRLH